MKDPDVLAALRDHVHAERVDDQALEAVARGEVESSAVAALEARAVTDPEVRAMVEASRPLDGAKLDAIAGAVGITPSASTTRAADGPGRSNVVIFLRRASVIVGPLALAAAIFLGIGRGGDGDKKSRVSLPALPEYAFVASGEKEMRGDTPPERAGELRLRNEPDATFEIVARPATTASGPVVAYVFVFGGAEPSAVEASVELAPEGSVRIRGRAQALRGAREVRVVIGTANDSLARAADALTRAREGRSDANVRVLIVPIAR